MNPFTERYKTLSNTDLLKIIDNQGDYQPLAFEAATAELLTRQLNTGELEKAHAEIDMEQQQKSLKKERRQAFENKVKDIGAQVIDAVHPIQQSTPSTNRIINFLSAAFGLMFLLTLFKEFSFISYMFFGGHSEWGMSMLLYLLPLFLVPVLTGFFWRRKRAGWILCCVYCSYSLISAVILFFIETIRYYREMHLGDLRPSFSPASFLWSFVFFGGCMWFICKRDVREVYQVNDKSAVLIAGITAAVTLGIIWGSLSRH
jgi:hypothetical protein